MERDEIAAPDARDVTPLGPAAALPAGPVLLYDGACGFCSGAVRWILRHDRRGTVSFAALQGRAAADVIVRHPELGDVDSLIWVEVRAGEPERAFSRSAAALRAAGYLGGRWRLALLGWLVPRPLRDACYDLVARHRHQLVAPGAACYVPPPELRARFPDLEGPTR